ncbi:hypothetical protein HDV05_002014 [Chytridiales sp. JEL 0842]|nr:hypothetical protein HDV05_002014 [Chytridiales sp. JEL 0842]
MGQSSSSSKPSPVEPELKKSESEWRSILSPEAYHVLREAGTERAFTGKYWDNHEEGVYKCGACKADLFSSRSKFESGTGWPSFAKPLNPQALHEKKDWSIIGLRTEILCRRCLSHLGHVFNDGPVEMGGWRYCMNSAALEFEKVDAGSAGRDRE